MVRIHLIVLAVLCAIAVAIYRPNPQSEFVLDDYYTIVHNPLIKQPALYPHIWHSRLFDAHKSSGYLKLSYYRPVLQSSYIIDYNLFRLNPLGYEWINVLIHIGNAFLVYWLCFSLFKRFNLALGTSVLFVVLPVHEWVVRYVTGRGDSLQAFFGLLFLLFLFKGFRDKTRRWSIYALIFLVLSALTREFGYLMPLYGILLFYLQSRGMGVTKFALCWTGIGSLSFLVTYQIIPKLGGIQALHLLYFTSIGLCMLLAQARLKLVMSLALILGVISFSQGRYWNKEEKLLRHLHSEERADRTVARQQLLMKYEEDIGAVNDILNHESNAIIRSMWFNRLGNIYRKHRQIKEAIGCLQESLRLNPKNEDALNALAVIYLENGQDREGRQLLVRSLKLDLHYPETLRLWGIYYYRQKDFQKARGFLMQSLFYDPDNLQARQLLSNS